MPIATMPRVMDRETAEHFTAWLDRYAREEDQHEIEQAIHALLAEYPDLVNTHSWPEMLALTGR